MGGVLGLGGGPKNWGGSHLCSTPHLVSLSSSMRLRSSGQRRSSSISLGGGKGGKGGFIWGGVVIWDPPPFYSPQIPGGGPTALQDGSGLSPPQTPQLQQLAGEDGADALGLGGGNLGRGLKMGRGI